MPETTNKQDLLIDRLADALQPVRRPRPAPWRALAWMALALPCGMLATRLMPLYVPDWSAPGMGWSMAEIALALVLGVAAAMLAFDTSIAGRAMRGRGVLVAVGVLWLAVCAANIAGTVPHIMPHAIPRGAGLYCYSFMMLASAPMMPMVIVALRRTRALHPGRTLAMAGVGIAFLVSGLLGFCHPGGLHLIDFIMHLAAGASIVTLTTVLGRRFIAA